MVKENSLYKCGCASKAMSLLCCEDKLNLLSILLLYACTAVQHYCGVHCWFVILSTIFLCLFLFYQPTSVIEVILYLQCISILAASFCIWSTFACLKRFCVCIAFMYLMRICLFEMRLCIWGTFAYLKSVSVVTLHFCICSTFAPLFF